MALFGAAAVMPAITGGSMSLGSILGGLQAGGSVLSGLGGLFGSSGGMSAAAQGRFAVEQQQRDFLHARDLAQNLPKWQVDGWKAAGIHPLAGMGMSQPSSGGASFGGPTSSRDWGSALDGMGQGISRAAGALASREDREFAKISNALTIEGQSLQNDRLRAEIALMQQPGTPPGMSPMASNADAVTSHDRGTIPMYTTVRTPTGDRLVPSPEYAQIMENYWPEAFRYMFGSDALPDRHYRAQNGDFGGMHRFLKRFWSGRR